MEHIPTWKDWFRKHLSAYVFGAFALALFQLSMNRIDWLSKRMIDSLFEVGRAPVLGFVFGMAGLSVVAFLLRLLSRWLFFFAGRDIEYGLRKKLLAQLHQLGVAFYRKVPAGDLMSRSTNDVAQVRMLMGFGLMNVVNVGLAFASALQIMLSISVKLTLVAFVSLPLFLMVTRLFAGKMFQKNKENQESLGAMSGFLQNHLAGIRLVRSFALEDAELRRFDEYNERYLEASLSLSRLRGLMGPIAGTISALGLLLFFWYGGSLLVHGEISKGGFFAFSMALVRMTWPMISMGIVMSLLQRGRASYARLDEIFRERSETPDGPLSPPVQVNGTLTVSHLSFSYGDRNVLGDVSFVLPARSSLSIVGRTGSGKSTLALLLSRLLPTPPGTVQIDGIDVCDVPTAFVHRVVGYAQQEAFLFSTTVAENIGFAMTEREGTDFMTQVNSAAVDAQIFEEVQTLPEQFQTVVGERGVQLSGGQKQRISLARALLARPSILILDDPLSAVDAKTEAAILDALFRRTDGMGLILITSRIAAARHCENIIVLEEGKVVQQGTHESLMREKGLYARFAEEQQRMGQLEALESSTFEGGAQ